MQQVHADKLGAIVMWELRDRLAIPLADLTDAWTGVGLDPKLLPKGRSATDAFRYATPPNRSSTGLQVERYGGPALKKQGLQMAAVVTRVGDTKSRIGKLHRGRASLALPNDFTGDLIINKPDKISADEEAYLEAIENTFKQAVEQTIDGNLVRAAFKRAALAAHAFLIRGGVFLFPETGIREAQALLGVIGVLDRYVPSHMPPNDSMWIDYLDTPLQREQLKTKLDLYIQETVESKMAELRNNVQAHQAGKRKFGERAAESVLQELTDLGKTIKEYELVLSEQLDTLHLYLAGQQILFEQELKKL